MILRPPPATLFQPYPLLGSVALQAGQWAARNIVTPMTVQIRVQRWRLVMHGSGGGSRAVGDSL